VGKGETNAIGMAMLGWRSLVFFFHLLSLAAHQGESGKRFFSCFLFAFSIPHFSLFTVS
jgi:hypothetical protein